MSEPKNRGGRPLKPPTPTALDHWQHFEPLVWHAVDRWAEWRPAFGDNEKAWVDLQAQLIGIAFHELKQLCRRYDPATATREPKNYLWHYLARRVGKRFRILVAAAVADVRPPASPWPTKPLSPRGRRRTSVGTWAALQPPTPAEALGFALSPGVVSMSDEQLVAEAQPDRKAMALLADHPEDVDLYEAVKRSRRRWARLLQELQQRVVARDIPAGHPFKADLLTMLRVLSLPPSTHVTRPPTGDVTQNLPQEAPPR